MGERKGTYGGTLADTSITATFSRSEWVMIGVALLGQAGRLDGPRMEQYDELCARVRDLLVDDARRAVDGGE